MNKDPLEIFPLELAEYMFAFLDDQSVLAASGVNKKWHKCLNSPNFWSQRHRELVGEYRIEPEKERYFACLKKIRVISSSFLGFIQEYFESVSLPTIRSMDDFMVVTSQEVQLLCNVICDRKMQCLDIVMKVIDKKPAALFKIVNGFSRLHLLVALQISDAAPVIAYLVTKKKMDINLGFDNPHHITPLALAIYLTKENSLDANYDIVAILLSYGAKLDLVSDDLRNNYHEIFDESDHELVDEKNSDELRYQKRQRTT